MARSKSRIALVGAETLLGHEIKEALESAGSLTVEGFAANGEGNFGEEEGEPVFRQALSPAAVKGCTAVVSAGSPEGAVKALDIAKGQPGRLKLIDCTGDLDAQPEAFIYGSHFDRPPKEGWLFTLPHAAASALALLISKLATYQQIARAVIEVFEPASERGRAGLAELQQQTTALLAFRPLEKQVYDTQVSFAMLPAYGEKASHRLDAIEQRIEKHLATLLARSTQKGAVVPMPSLRLIQAPVFHGYSFSMWAEFGQHVEARGVLEALKSEDIDVRTSDHEMPTNVGVAGQSGLSVGDIRVDHNNSRALWLWAAADNFSIIADQVHELVSQWESQV
jgi:aspartate-semialdehyde dehydrogenase